MNGRRHFPIGFALVAISLSCVSSWAGLTGSWQPYVKNFAPNPSFDYGNRSAALWLDKA